MSEDRAWTHPASLILRTDLRRRWRSWLLLGLITGITVGVLIAAAAGARRTASAFERFTDAAHLADFTVGVRDRAGSDQIAATRGVAGIARVAPVPTPVFIEIDGRLFELPTDATVAVTDDQYGDDIEGLSMLEGRRAERGAFEAVINPAFGQAFDVDVGDRIQIVAVSEEIIGRYFSIDQLGAAYAADPTLGRPYPVTIVGRGIRGGDLVRDAASRPAYLALDRLSVASWLGITTAEVDERAFEGGHQVAVRLAPGASVDAVLAAIQPVVDLDLVELETIRDDFREATRPYVVALIAFAVLAGFTTVIVIGGAFARQSIADSGSDPVLRSLGASRRLLTYVAAVRVGAVAIVGVLVAVTVATVLSALFPLGPAARAEPDRGLQIDIVVFTVAAGATLVGAFVTGALVGHRTDRLRRNDSTARTNFLGQSTPLTWAVAFRFTFSSAGRARELRRSTLIALITALVGGCAVAVFASSLDGLFDHPERHGWRGDLVISCNQGYCDLNLDTADSLRATPGVRGWSFLSFSSVELDGHRVPVVAAGFGRGEIAPFTVNEGRPPSGDDEIALGATTMRELDVGIGDTVSLASGQSLHVVGRSVFSGLGPADTRRASLGEGAAMTAAGWHRINADSNLPEAVVVEVDGDPRAAAAAVRQQLPWTSTSEMRRPAALETWPSLRVVPLVLVLLLGALALATLTHGLATSTRLLRRDFAVLRALGMSHGSLIRVVLAQAAILLATALAIAAPIGILAGVVAWRLVTDRIGVSSTATIAPLVALVTVGGILVAAPILAALPASQAGRRADLTSLRTE